LAAPTGMKKATSFVEVAFAFGEGDGVRCCNEALLRGCTVSDTR